MTPRRNAPITRVASTSTAPGRRNRDGIIAGNQAASRSFSSSPPFACGLAPIRDAPFGASSASSGRSRLQRRRAPRADNSSSSVREASRARGSRASPPSAPDGFARILLFSSRRLPWDPSILSASGGRSSASSGRSVTMPGVPASGFAGWSRQLCRASPPCARAWALAHRLRRSTACSRIRKRSMSSSRLIRASTVGLAILYPFKWRIGSTAPSVAGLRNLFECQLVASGPVSASPSPITQATSRSGLSKAAP